MPKCGIFGLRELLVSNAFHSRIVAPAGDVLFREAKLPEDKLGLTTAALISSLTGTELTSGHLLTKHFAEQVTSRVDFIAAAKAMAKRCDFLLEVGPGRVLSQLCRDIPETQALMLAALEAKPNDDQGFNQAMASLFVAGTALNLSRAISGTLGSAVRSGRRKIILYQSL